MSTNLQEISKVLLLQYFIKIFWQALWEQDLMLKHLHIVFYRQTSKQSNLLEQYTFVPIKLFCNMAIYCLTPVYIDMAIRYQ